METITLKVRTKKQAELLLAKIKELENENFVITANYNPNPVREKAAKKAKVAPAKQVIITKAEKATIKGLKELKQVLNGSKKSIDAKEALKNL